MLWNPTFISLLWSDLFLVTLGKELLQLYIEARTKTHSRNFIPLVLGLIVTFILRELKLILTDTFKSKRVTWKIIFSPKTAFSNILKVCNFDFTLFPWENNSLWSSESTVWWVTAQEKINIYDLKSLIISPKKCFCILMMPCLTQLLTKIHY